MSRERFKCFVQLRDFATGLAGPLMAWWSPPAIDQLVHSKLALSQQCHVTTVREVSRSPHHRALLPTRLVLTTGSSLVLQSGLFVWHLTLCHKQPSVGHPPITPRPLVMEQSCHALGWKSSNAIKCCSADTIPKKFLLRPMWIGRHVDCLGAAVALRVPATQRNYNPLIAVCDGITLWCTIVQAH